MRGEREGRQVDEVGGRGGGVTGKSEKCADEVEGGAGYVEVVGEDVERFCGLVNWSQAVEQFVHCSQTLGSSSVQWEP